MNQLRVRFILFFLVISILPVGVVGVVTYRMSTAMIVEQRIRDIANKLEKAISDVDKKAGEKETLGIKVYLDSYVQKLLIGGALDQETVFQTTKLLFSNEYTDVNDFIFLCDKKGRFYTNSMISEQEARMILEKGKKKLEKTGQTYEWLEEEEISEIKFIPYIREIDDLYRPDNDDKGYFVVGLQEELLRNIYESYFPEDRKNIYVISPGGRILSGEDESRIGEIISEFSGLEQYEPDTWDRNQILQLDGKGYYPVCVRDEKRDWNYLYLLEDNIALSGMRNIGFVLMAGVICSIALSIIMSVIASSWIIRPINELISTIQKVEKGDMGIRFRISGIKELAELGEFFNNMMQKLQASIQEIYRVQKQRRDAEMRALVLQINPHFLYNTLSSIIWLCSADKKEEVIEMTNSLATLFRISISKGQEIVTLREEFEHVKSYVRIQQIRFDNSFLCDIELGEDIANCYTLKVILQPLVENSVNHGLTNIDYQGHIVIRAEREHDIITLYVIDNAAGMTEEEVESLNRQLRDSNQTETKHGIGTSNVNERIKLTFGGDYGLHYEKRGKNIIAEVTIPVVYDAKDL